MRERKRERPEER